MSTSTLKIAEPITLNNKCMSAARFPFLPLFTDDNNVVTQVPIFIPRIIK